MVILLGNYPQAQRPLLPCTIFLGYYKYNHLQREQVNEE